MAWDPPTTGNNSITFSADTADSIDGPYDDTDVESSVTVNAKVTLTWAADPAGDPPPPTVWVVEKAEADAFAAGKDASATANDGLSPADVLVKNSQTDQDGALMATPSNLPGGGLLKMLPVSGGVAFFYRSLSASGTSTYSSTDTFPGIQNASVSDTVSIHAQPYNFRQTLGQSNYNGTLTFSYTWLSTDGDVSHLTSCVVYEHVTYQGPHGTSDNPSPYQPPSPPWDMAWSSPPNGLHDPTELPNPKWPATNVNPATGVGLGDNQNIVGGFILPANNTDNVTSSFTATQNFWFDDTVTNENRIQIPGPDSGPISIVRSVHNNYNPIQGYPTPYGYVYTVIKNGVSAHKTLTP